MDIKIQMVERIKNILVFLMFLSLNSFPLNILVKNILCEMPCENTFQLDNCLGLI